MDYKTPPYLTVRFCVGQTRELPVCIPRRRAHFFRYVRSSSGALFTNDDVPTNSPETDKKIFVKKSRSFNREVVYCVGNALEKLHALSCLVERAKSFRGLLVWQYRLLESRHRDAGNGVSTIKLGIVFNVLVEVAAFLREMYRRNIIAIVQCCDSSMNFIRKLNYTFIYQAFRLLEINRVISIWIFFSYEGNMCDNRKAIFSL